jgi:hypothetical protein
MVRSAEISNVLLKLGSRSVVSVPVPLWVLIVGKHVIVSHRPSLPCLVPIVIVNLTKSLDVLRWSRVAYLHGLVEAKLIPSGNQFVHNLVVDA